MESLSNGLRVGDRTKKLRSELLSFYCLLVPKKRLGTLENQEYITSLIC